ncbi:hypothetical protein JAAARDRAFT_50044 [Jaapia argillacea MUCL 33604]|uniref:Uncharacterized protein n=1 Tax=Jaapia argillacea MUCL 33604 TaxID=933084 RepID=A0A067PNB7_9AGAM|nr:hypothetical protein JAAARDRAFT_50044 [Jaapia argillacea MUCL 33604]
MTDGYGLAVIKRNTIPHDVTTGSPGSDNSQSASVKVTLMTPHPHRSHDNTLDSYTSKWALHTDQFVFSETQEEQDHDDEAAKKKAMKELVQSWMDRLQLISLIPIALIPLRTTFFASVESQLIGSILPSTPGSASVTLQIENAGLMDALVMHSSAAIISFLAASLLIRFKLMEAKKEEAKVEGGGVQSPVDLEKNGSAEGIKHADASQRSHVKAPRSHPTEPPLFSSDPPPGDSVTVPSATSDPFTVSMPFPLYLARCWLFYSRARGDHRYVMVSHASKRWYPPSMPYARHLSLYPTAEPGERKRIYNLTGQQQHQIQRPTETKYLHYEAKRTSQAPRPTIISRRKSKDAQVHHLRISSIGAAQLT